MTKTLIFWNPDLDITLNNLVVSDTLKLWRCVGNVCKIALIIL